MCAQAYDPAELAGTEGAGAASLGCGNPLAVAELIAGETVLDLGSGMLDLARQHAREAGATNVEFLRGHIEAIPLPDASVDVVISNCVINLFTDKPAGAVTLTVVGHEPQSHRAAKKAALSSAIGAWSRTNRPKGPGDRAAPEMACPFSLHPPPVSLGVVGGGAAVATPTPSRVPPAIRIATTLAFTDRISFPLPDDPRSVICFVGGFAD